MSTTNINITDSVIMIKEQRRCGSCGSFGHNKRTCPLAEKTDSSVKNTKVDVEEVVYWTPNLFSGGGIKSMPQCVAWAPGTDSIAFYNQMKSLPFYKYDELKKVWRRT